MMNPPGIPSDNQPQIPEQPEPEQAGTPSGPDALGDLGDSSGPTNQSQFQNKPPDKDIPKNSSMYTMQPKNSNLRLGTGDRRRLDDTEWAALSNDLYNDINAALSARDTFEKNLREWREAYDLVLSNQHEDANQFEGSSSRLPYIATQVESVKAYIAGTVLVPRLYMVAGKTPSATKVAYDIERFYNSELIKARSDSSTYFHRYINLIHLGLRDGTAIAEVLWNKTRKKTNIISEEQEVDAQGQPVLNDKTMPKYKNKITPTEILLKDYSEITPVSIKDFLLLPAESKTIGSAAAAARALWLYEDDLMKLVKAGNLKKSEVERILTYAPSGNTEVAADRQGSWDKNRQGQIDTGMGQGSLTSKFFKKRGPFKVWRIHSSQYDMNLDGHIEENVFWLHEQSQRMLGWIEYNYPSEARPFFSYTPYPNPDEFLGYSLVERLARVQSELDLQHDTRIDNLIRKMQAPLIADAGEKIEGEVWQGNQIWRIKFKENGQPTIKVLEVPDVPVASYQEEQLLKRYGDEYTALNQPAIGGQSSGKRSATELRQQSAASATRLALICNQLRITLGEIINFQHLLNKTYMEEDPSVTVPKGPGEQKIFKLPLSTLLEDVEIGITGSTDPIDSATRKNEILSFVEQMLKFPTIQNDLVKQRALQQKVCEVYGIVNVEEIIGTPEQAQQAMQAQQEAAKKQQMINAAQQVIGLDPAKTSPQK